MCEEALEADGEYEIIRHSNPQATEDELRRMHSMWSSRRAKSMRLKQYGNWIAYEDKVLNGLLVQWIWESQWDKPDEVTAIQNAKLAEAKGEWEALRKTSMNSNVSETGSSIMVMERHSTKNRRASSCMKAVNGRFLRKLLDNSKQ